MVAAATEAVGVFRYSRAQAKKNFRVIPLSLIICVHRIQSLGFGMLRQEKRRAGAQSSMCAGKRSLSPQQAINPLTCEKVCIDVSFFTKFPGVFN